MKNKVKLILALTQIDSLTKLLEGNEYQKHLYSHLTEIEVELKRQLNHYE